MKKPKVYVEVCREGIKLPQYENLGDVGLEIVAAEEVILLPGETKVVPTGLKITIPQGYELQIRPGSVFKNLPNTPLKIAATPGIIDNEIGIIVYNSSPKQFRIENNLRNGNLYECLLEEVKLVHPLSIDGKINFPGSYIIKAGDKIAQLVLARYTEMKIEQVNSIETLETNRGGYVKKFM